MSKYIMAFDAGTTSSRCIIFNRKGEICESAQKELTQHYPKPGWVEHDADTIWSTQLSVAVEAMAKLGINASDIAAIGITNQRETTIVWDKETGNPVYRAIVWQCRRTADYCNELKNQGYTDMIRQKTCFERGEAKSTYGTGCFLLMNTGETPVKSDNGLVTTIAWGLKGRINYALEGSVFVAGASIQWLRDEMRMIDSSADSEYMAMKVNDTHGCYVVPAFTGLGAPYWDQYARGTIVGITRGVNKYHIIRATLESMAYQVRDVLDVMEKDSNIVLKVLNVDGGASVNNFLMQTQADLCNVPVERPKCVETTAIGVAYLAGLAVGFWNGIDDIKKSRSIDRTFTPNLSDEIREEKIRMWKKAVKYAFGWAKEE